MRGTVNVSPKISVVIPSYNYAKYLRQCVRSAAEQPGVDHEVVIVENASTDGSLDIARSLANEYPNVRLVTYTSNEGIIASLNRCWSEVRGEYGVLLCADDLLTSGSLARSLAFMEVHPNVGLVFGPADEFSGDDAPTETADAMREAPPVIHSGEAWITERCRSGMNPIFTPEAMIRTEVLRKVGGANPELPHTSDLNLWLRIASEADVAYLTGCLQALYRRHSSNHSAAYLRSISMELQQRWAAFEQFFLTVASHPKRAEWEMLVRKALAKEGRYRAAREFSLAGGVSAGSDYKALLVFADALDPAISLKAGREFTWAIRVWMGPKAANLMPSLWVTRIHRLLQRYLWKRRARRIGI
jgi:glycosyltransferase involved in cell wall biosynthesis